MMTTRKEWLVAGATMLLMVSACCAQGTTEMTEFKHPFPPVEYSNTYTVTVYVDDVTRKASVDKTKLVVEVKGRRPVGIRWMLDKANRSDWSLMAIEWRATKGNVTGEDGNHQFVEDPAAPPGGGVAIHLIDKNTDTEPTRYPYAIWVAPKNGMGPPIELDPIIENRPPD